MLKALAYALLLIIVLLSAGLAAAWLYLRTPDRPAAELERRYAGADDHFIELPGGLRLHYRDQGDRSRPVLVLLHGYGDSYATWEAWGQALQDRYQLVPAQTVFFDDLLGNVQAARGQGWHAVQFHNAAQAQRDLAAISSQIGL